METTTSTQTAFKTNYSIVKKIVSFFLSAFPFTYRGDSQDISRRKDTIVIPLFLFCLLTNIKITNIKIKFDLVLFIY